jgi:heterodisulfide reductase subunit A-like polyferredoxin
MSSTRVAVIGAGVVGLVTALQLAKEPGIEVHIVYGYLAHLLPLHPLQNMC